MSKIKVLVLGSSSPVGSRFVELSRNYLFPEIDSDVNLKKMDVLNKLIESFKPEWVINFNEIQSEREINSLVSAFPSNKIIQLSSDKVFPATLDNPGPYSENDKTTDVDKNPEKIILNHGGSVLRITNENYINEELKKFSDGTLEPLSIDRQICVSNIDEVVATLQKIIDTDSSGIFHCSSDTTTPYELITFVVDQLGGDSSAIKPVSTEAYYGGLKSLKTENKLDLHFSTWQTAVEKLIGHGLSLR